MLKSDASSDRSKPIIDEDGVIWTWDAASRGWTPSIDDALLRQQQAAYLGSSKEVSVPVEQKETIVPPFPELDSDVVGEKDTSKKRKRSKKKKKGWSDASSTSIYISGLPLDVSQEELMKEFSQFGVIKKDEEGRPRVKIYRDADGNAKGDGLVTYLGEGSVENAVFLKDDAPFSVREASEKSYVLSVARASFEQKGEFKAKSKKKQKRLAQQYNVLGWDEHAEKLQRTVVFSNVFDPEELVDPNAASELEKEIRSKVQQEVGAVDSVVVFEANKKGIVIVKFFNADDASDCVKTFQGRFFAKRKIRAEIYDGVQDFAAQESAVVGEKRSKSFGDWLESKGT